MKKILVVVSHPDDETFGCGGTIARFSEEGNRIYVSFLSEGTTAQYDDRDMIKKRREMARGAGNVLGIYRLMFHDFKDLCMDQAGQLNINHVIEKDIARVNPDIIFIHTEYEINTDHKLAHNSCLVAARNINKTLSFEIPLSTTNQFRPNFFVDITETYEKKREACRAYYSEVEKWLPRIEKLAIYRGMQANVGKAEAFMVDRWIV